MENKYKNKNKKKNMNKNIVIIGSSKFLDKIEKLKDYLVQKGYNVIEYPKQINHLDENVYINRYKSFFKALDSADEIFVANFDKNEIKGYVGAESFAELSFIVANNVLKNENRKIYLLNEPSKDVSSYFELNSFIKLGIVKIWDEEVNL